MLFRSQSRSENSTSIGVREQDVEEAVSVLNNEFKNEIAEWVEFALDDKVRES